jgi:murein DD-endopeptidase MepM/ murein hydrolase activator NlpD
VLQLREELSRLLSSGRHLRGPRDEGAGNRSRNGVQQDRKSDLQKRLPDLQIKGRDGRYYFYTHFAGGSLRVKVGNRVGVGEILGRVGGSRCASGTSPHLHIQMYGGPIYGDAQSVNIQPLLTRLFDKLRP